MPAPGFTFRPTGRRDIRNAAASGLLNTLLYGEERIKSVSVVRGGNRSFLTGAHLGGPLGIADITTRRVPRSALTKAGTVRVGGTLRRAWHSIVYVDGRPFPGSRTMTENHEPVPTDYPTGGSPSGIVGIIGNNAGYAGWVDQGTYKMPARPMLLPGLREMIGNVASLFSAGWRKYASGKS